MKLEFIMCGNHTDAFLSQAAIFRRALDSFGGIHAAARLVLCVGGPERKPLPDRWRGAFQRIELHWVDGPAYTPDDLAQSELTYRVIDTSADLSVICDADTVLIRPLPDDFLAEMRASPALVGCIAHYPPSLHDVRDPPAPRLSSTAALWQTLARRLLPGELPMPYSYSLSKSDEAAPFYINLGFFGGPPEMLRAFHREHRDVVPIVREVLENDFYEQISVPFAVARAGLPSRALPMRFNFPNDPVADRRYPGELPHIHVLHYLRLQHFDRHRIVADPEAFESLMGLDLTGSNAVFRDAVRQLTGGVYPFPSDPKPEMGTTT